MHGFIGEFFGTMILILLGAGTSAGFNLNKSYPMPRVQTGCLSAFLGGWR